MSVLDHPIRARPFSDAIDRTRAAAGLTTLGLLAVGLAFSLYRMPPSSLGLVAVAGLGSVGVLMLAITRYDLAVAAGFLIFGVVQVQPAPPDLFFICVIAVALLTGRFNLDRLSLAVVTTVGAFVGLNLLSMTEVISPGKAAFFLSITLYLAVFSLWLATYVDSPRRARIVLCAYLAGAVISATIGVLAVLAPIPGREMFLYAGDRAQAFFKDPNVFGPFLVPAILLLLQEILTPRLLKINRVLEYVMLIVLVLGVVFSFSRAAWLNLAVGVLILALVLLLAKGTARRAAKLLTLVVVAMAVTVFVLSVTGSINFLDERASIQHYDNQRFGAQEFGIRYAEHHPLGAGPGQFDVLSPISAHSTYIRVLVEEGFLGLVILFAIVLITLLLALRNAALGRSTYGIGSAALLGAWCGVLANSFFVDTLHWRHLWMLTGLIWAAAMRPTQAPPLPAPLPTPRAINRPSRR